MRDPAMDGDRMMTRAERGARIIESGGGPAVHHAPATERELVDLLQGAGPHVTFRIRGAGTWASVTERIRADATLDLSRLSGITEYIPGDLTLTARAGTTLAEIAEATRANGQWLPLDPWGAPTGTLGATLATASTGPLAATLGLPRDAALGLSLVDAAGVRTTAGGRVVKNVAGFDLVRLQVGACGTLGILTEATVRLRPLPAVDRSCAIPLPAAQSDLTALLASLRQIPLSPLAMEALNPTLAASAGLPPAQMLLVRVGGSHPAVAQAVEALARHPHTTEIPSSAWPVLSASEPADAMSVRYSVRPSQWPSLWTTVCAASDASARVHGTPSRGVVRVVGPAETQHRVQQAVAPLGAVEIAEPAGRGVTGVPALAELGRRVRDAFDPQRRLNPGVMDDGRS